MALVSALANEELLAAIYAAPHDDAPRLVYADWLLERGDPRGELITLQLASRDARNDARIGALLQAHGRAWAGTLDAHLEPKGRVFERGFLARGVLLEAAALAFDDPAWATVRALEVRSRVAARLPMLRWLEELEVEFDPDVEVTEALAKSPSFPNVRRLAFVGPVEHAAILLAGSLGRQLEVVTHFGGTLDALVQLVARVENVLEVRTIDAAYGDREPWRLVLRRDARGHFTAMSGVRHVSESGVGDASRLETALSSLGADALTSLTLDVSKPCPYDAAEIRNLERALARFTRLDHVVVPWERLGERVAVGPDVVPVFGGFFRGPPFDRADAARVLAQVMAPPLSLVFDAYDVDGGAHRTLEDDALTTLTRELSAPEASPMSPPPSTGWGIAFYRKRELGRLEIARSTVDIEALVGRDAVSIDRYLVWLAHLAGELRVLGDVPFVVMDEVRGEDASLATRRVHRRERDDFRGIPDLRVLRSFDRRPEWVWLLEPELDARFPFAELEKLPRRPGLEWLRVLRTGHALMFVLGATPADPPTDAQLRALDIATFDVGWTEHERRVGPRPHTRALEVMTRRLVPLGYEREPTSDVDEARGVLTFVARRPDDTRTLHFEPTIYWQSDDRRHVVVPKLIARHSHAVTERTRTFDTIDDLPTALSWLG